MSSGRAGCGTEAKYNLPGEPHGAYCGQHKLKDMERVNTRRCSADGCDKRASFNDPGRARPAPVVLPEHPPALSRTDCAYPAFDLSCHAASR